MKILSNASFLAFFRPKTRLTVLAILPIVYLTIPAKPLNNAQIGGLLISGGRA